MPSTERQNAGKRPTIPPWLRIAGQPTAGPTERLSWRDICRRPDCQGRWVALHECRYDELTGHATEGALVDADDDLAALCERVRSSAWKNCAILFCGNRV